jgi:RNA polymerase sigma factor (sigma-70 family)
MEHKSTEALSALEDSFVGRLYRQHAVFLMTYVRRHVRLREDSEDIVLEVFLATLQQHELVHLSEEQQLAWLLRVALNKIADHHRRAGKWVAQSLDEAATAIPADEQSLDQLVLRDEEHARLREQLGQLPEQYQLVLYLRFAVGLRSTEIAARLHKSPGAVRMTLVRALNTLRDTCAGR